MRKIRHAIGRILFLTGSTIMAAGMIFLFDVEAITKFMDALKEALDHNANANKPWIVK